MRILIIVIINNIIIARNNNNILLLFFLAVTKKTNDRSMGISAHYTHLHDDSLCKFNLTNSLTV